MFDGLYQSIISFYIPYVVYAYSTTHSVDGHDFSVWEFGTTVAVCAVTAANLFVGLHIRYWTWMVFVVIIASTLAIHVWIAIYSQFPVFTFQNEIVCEFLPALLAAKALADVCVADLYSTLNFWTSLVFVIVAAIGPKFIWKYIQSAYYPLDSDIVREMEVLGSCGKEHLDLEAQSKHEDHPLVPSPTSSNPLRERNMSDGSEDPRTPYGQADGGAAMERGGTMSSQGPIPTIQVHGTTPRGSMASRYSEGDFDTGAYEGDATWDYSNVPSTSASDLNRRSGHEQEESGESWKSAQSGGYAV